MKKTLLLLAAALFLTAALAGCGKSAAPAQSAPDEGVETTLTIDGYSAVGWLFFYEKDQEGNTTECETGSISISAYSGLTVAEVLDAVGISNLTIVGHGQIFEGWLVYRDVVTVDSDGFEFIHYEKAQPELCTPEELMATKLTDEPITFVAKWQSVSDEEYYDMYEAVHLDDEGEAEESFYLSLYSNGGVIYMGESEPYEDVALSGSTLYEGDLMADVLSAPIQKVEKAGATFTGWAIYTAPDYEVVMVEPTDLAVGDRVIDMGQYGYLVLRNADVYRENATTEELSAIVCEATHYFAIPNWN